VRTKTQLGWLYLPLFPIGLLPPPVTAKQRLVIILWDQPEEGINGGKDFEKRKVLKRESITMIQNLVVFSQQSSSVFYPNVTIRNVRFFAIAKSVCLSSLSVCLSYVTFMHHTQELKLSAIFLRHCVP